MSQFTLTEIIVPGGIPQLSRQPFPSLALPLVVCGSVLLGADGSSGEICGEVGDRVAAELEAQILQMLDTVVTIVDSLSGEASEDAAASVDDLVGAHVGHGYASRSGHHLGLFKECVRVVVYFFVLLHQVLDHLLVADLNVRHVRQLDPATDLMLEGQNALELRDYG